MPAIRRTTSILSLAAATISAAAVPAFAVVVTTGTSTATLVQTNQTLSGANTIAVVGTDSIPSFATIDFSTAALGFTNSTRASSINSVTLSLTDLTVTPPASSSIIDIYLSTSSVSPSTLAFQTASAPQGIGSQLNTLTQVGNIDLSSSAGRGTTFSPNLTLTADTQSYILNQLNLGNAIRVVLAPDSSSVAGSFEGSNGNLTNVPPLPAPQLRLNLNTATRLTGDANGDGHVDILDLQILANDWQQPLFGPSKGDFNSSGTVDIVDLQALANDWQAGVGSGSGSSEFLMPAFAASPEPGSLLLMLGAPLLLRRQRAHHSRHISR